MGYEAWRAIAERFGRKYGVEVYVGGDRAYSNENAIYLPGDVPDKMQDALHGLFLHEKEHIVQKDCAFNKSINDPVLAHALNVLQDIHNDTLVIEQDPGAESLYQKVMEYVESKFPIDQQKKKLAWQQMAVQEILNRGYPKSVREGRFYTDNRMVKQFFKRNKREVRKLLREMKDLRPDRDAQLKWAKWLVEKLFEGLIQEQAAKLGIPQGQQGQQGQGIPDAILDAIRKAIEKMGGLIPPKLSHHSFECISPGDLKQKVPEATTVQQLKEYLTDKLEERTPDDSGSIDPSKLPTYWDENQDLFTQDVDRTQKRVRITMLLDASGSMSDPLPDGNRKVDALVRATGLVAQACDRIVRDEGYEVTLEAWSFGVSDRLVKRAEERWDPGEFKRRYWRGGEDSTLPGRLIQNINAVPTDSKTKDVVIVVTDGAFGDDGMERLREAQGTGKNWLLIGIGDYVPDDQLFRFVAKSLDEIEYILCQAVKEAAR